MRCEHHTPLAALAAQFDEDPESEAPLVEVGLDEYEVPFGYVEDGERKECLVKVVLCGEDGRRLMLGRRRAKRGQEERGLERKGDHSQQSTDGRLSRTDARGARVSSAGPQDLSKRRRSASPPRHRHRHRHQT